MRNSSSNANRVLESITEPVVIATVDGTIEAVNAAAVRLFRSARSDLVGANVAAVLHRPRVTARTGLDDAARFRDLVEPARVSHGVADLDLLAAGANDPDVSVTIAALPDDGGDPGWVFTVRRRATAAVTTTAARRSRLFDTSLDLVGAIDRDGFFVDANPAWSVLGYSSEDLFSHAYLDLVFADDRDRVAAEVEALRADKAFTSDFTCRLIEHEGGIRWYQWTAIHDPFHDTVTGVGHDVSQRVHRSQQLNAQIRQLRTREKQLVEELQSTQDAMRATDDLLLRMSHEVRTPLSSVIGFAGLLAENPNATLSELDLTYLERIHRNGLRVLGLIEDVLDRGRADALDATTIEPVQIAAIVSEAVLQSEGAAAAKGCPVVIELPSHLPPVQAKQQALVQVLINLVGNAIKFSDHGPVVVRVHQNEDGRADRIDVVDHGPGIARLDHDAIFTAFWRGSTSEANHRGTGLGLSISRALCREMGFELVVASVEGSGSTFSILLDDDVDPPVHAADCLSG